MAERAIWGERAGEILVTVPDRQEGELKRGDEGEAESRRGQWELWAGSISGPYRPSRYRIEERDGSKHRGRESNLRRVGRLIASHRRREGGLKRREKGDAQGRGGQWELWPAQLVSPIAHRFAEKKKREVSTMDERVGRRERERESEK